MIFRKKTYHIKPEGLEAVTDFFHTYLLPNQWKHGAKLVGRWVSEDKCNITAVWQYESYEAYEQIEKRVRTDELHTQAQAKKPLILPFILSSSQEFMESTGDYHVPRHIVAVSGLIQNEAGETLLVKTNWRNDTWELPGGQVEEGEPLETALVREILEETAINVKLTKTTGVYQNITSRIVSVVFKGMALNTEIVKQDSEIQEAKFVMLTEENASEYITRFHIATRAIDALKSEGSVPVESVKVKPYERLHRIGN
ncbi:NUDIX domain-containing protein [Pseudalkalibacillus salsuginis]|uniref:NUDIX domain-containing protein n=1 Tax=Pseudalkalibacillus salsuginis TaxID=2910972 RepID=UPI001F4908C1|nr:NUDIX domain-containing protein [Pseudalkalibacillus salsuginis]MCF6411191.1 NUDIX domain-containing protein [Pseudalkalibacillus salsuginis]